MRMATLVADLVLCYSFLVMMSACVPHLKNQPGRMWQNSQVRPFALNRTSSILFLYAIVLDLGFDIS